MIQRKMAYDPECNFSRKLKLVCFLGEFNFSYFSSINLSEWPRLRKHDFTSVDVLNKKRFIYWKLMKKRLQHSYFPVNIARILRTSILRNIYEKLLLNNYISINSSNFRLFQKTLKIIWKNVQVRGWVCLTVFKY